MDQGAWIVWAIEAERLFEQALSASDPALTRYRKAVERYTERQGNANDLSRNLMGTFDACRAALENAPPQEIETRLAAGASVVQPQDRPTIRLFISHASTDATLAGLVADLLRSALGLAPTAIRCTSVDGYRLPGGADVDDEIRREVQQAEAVVGILSVSSLASLYVAFELGARWGLNRPLIPLMAPGFQPSEIRGPLTGKNALAAGNASQLHDLVVGVGKQLDITPHPASSYQSKLDAIVSLRDAQSAPASARSAGAPAEARSAPAVDSPDYWKRLPPEERSFLILLWRSEKTFITDSQFQGLRHLYQWDHPTWNRMEHTLAEAQRLIVHGGPLVGYRRAEPGWRLTELGRRVLTAAHERNETAMPTAPKFNAEWKP